ncbi:MAG: glycogen debranching N-terminal domain-containing protein [Chloroflexota bacterium]
MTETTTLLSGYTVLCCAPDGSIEAPRHGLLYRDTRILSRYRLTIDGRSPELVGASRPETDRWDAVLRLGRPGGHAIGPLLPQDALEIHVRRRVGPALREELALVNHSAVVCETTLRIEVDGDFRDIAELGRERQVAGTTTRTVETDRAVVRFDHLAEHEGRRFERSTRIEVLDASSPAEVGDDGFTFSIRLDPRASWRVTWELGALDAGEWVSPARADDDTRSRQRRTWRRVRPTVDAADRLRRPFDRASDDLFDLRNWELERRFLGSTDGAGWVINAGAPMFTGLFGRDILTAGWQSALLGTRALRGALEAVAATQATTDDAWRDAEPGKLIHELREGPLVELGISPRDAYYGSVTTPAMFLLGLSELWHWTGDDDLLRRHLDTAVRAMEWSRLYGDRDGDGFLAYQRRSPRGLRNQGWKDSDEAIRHVDGSISEGSIATVEEQAFQYLALQRMAEILIGLEDDRADAFLGRAADLRERWDAAFWMPDEGFYALALDGRREQVRSIASNPGHALGSGIVPRDRARLVADRLLAPDLFNGWGIRSLSSEHASYNPFAYHLGAMWPVEQATFALGFKRYGLDEHVDRLVEGVLDAVAACEGDRLPEALSGHGPSEVPAPIPYPTANNPQAWSASALVQMVQIMLGLYPFAPLALLAVVRPRLPAWLPELTIRRVRVGRGTVDLHFERRPDGSASWKSRTRGRVAVIGAGPPNDVGGGGAFEALEREVLRRAPGRLARAARIGIGLEESG